MSRLQILCGAVTAALMIGMTACSSGTGLKDDADATAAQEDNALCEAQPAKIEWSGHTYRLIQESTGMEPMMKFGRLDCEAER